MRNVSGLLAYDQLTFHLSLTAQVIYRGTRSAGYGFVSLNSADSVQKALELLNKKELDGRPLIVEVAKPADQKEGKKERKFKRKPGRRGSKAVPGEITEAEANGEVIKAEDATPATDEAAKPKKKKKTNVSATYSSCSCLHAQILFQRKSKARKAEGEGAAEDRKSTRLNSSHSGESRMPSSA